MTTTELIKALREASYRQEINCRDLLNLSIKHLEDQQDEIVDLENRIDDLLDQLNSEEED